jgi:hypothetical protein
LYPALSNKIELAEEMILQVLRSGAMLVGNQRP